MSSAPQTNTLRGIGWMVLTGLNFVCLTALVKHLGSDLPTAQTAFLRFVLGLVFFLPALPSLLALRLSRGTWVVLGWRGVAHTVGVLCWFYAMARIPMAEVTAMNYLNPVYVTLGAALFLGEKLAAPRMMAIAAAVVGMLIILRPGFRELEAGHFAMLITALGLGASYLLAGVASREADAGAVVAVLSVTVTIGLAPFAIAVWETPSWTQLGGLLGVAWFATAGHFCMTKAFRNAPMAVVQPVAFLQLVWATLLGAWLFDEGVDVWVILGGAIIIAAVSVIAWREALARRRRARETDI